MQNHSISLRDRTCLQIDSIIFPFSGKRILFSLPPIQFKNFPMKYGISSKKTPYRKTDDGGWYLGGIEQGDFLYSPQPSNSNLIFNLKKKKKKQNTVIFAMENHFLIFCLLPGSPFLGKRKGKASNDEFPILLITNIDIYIYVCVPHGVETRRIQKRNKMSGKCQRKILTEPLVPK